MVRVALRYDALNRDGDADLPETERRQRMKEHLQALSDEELFSVAWVDKPLPGPARLFKTVKCARCGEGVTEARVHLQDGQHLCPECYGPVYTRNLT